MSTQPKVTADDIDVVKGWPNSAGPWVLIHKPTGQRIATPRALPQGGTFDAYPFKLKRDAIAAKAAIVEASL